jgi:hypothetical protein
VDSPGLVARCNRQTGEDNFADESTVQCMATTTSIGMHLRNLATRHRGETAGRVADQAADLATRVLALETEVAKLKQERGEPQAMTRQAGGLDANAEAKRRKIECARATPGALSVHD